MKSEDLEKYFGTLDFVVFFASLILSALIGVYFGYKDKNKKSIETYYYGDRSVSPFAVGMSMAVSFVSAITVLGYPVEAYYYGIVFLWVIVATFLAASIASIYFIPLIFRLQLKSMYEYLELRYNKYVRRLCSGIYIFDIIMYMGNTVYLPALALNSVTPLDLEWSIAVTSIVCTFYTTLGGIKAVIWTDVLQGFIMVFGTLALFIKASVDIGGVGAVFESAKRGGRFNFFSMESDIRMRSSTLNYFLGYFILTCSSTCFSQVFAQRYLSCKSINKARKAAMIRVIPVAVFMLLAAADGLAMYAYYEGCDPYEAGYVAKKDQLTPRFAVEVFRTLPGAAGLFVAAGYSGTLSTVSSGINSLAAVTTEDFIDPFWPGMSVSKKSRLAKIFTIFYGCLVTCVAYAVSQLQSTVFQISLLLAGIFNGPVFGVFLLGTMCPWVNSKGVIGGIIVGSSFSAWCAIGRIIHGVSPKFVETLPVSVAQCYVNTTSSTLSYELFTNISTELHTAEALPHRSVLEDTLYSISPFLYGIIGFVIGCVSMIIISGITGFNKPSEMKPEIFVPIIDNKKIFSKRIVKFFRCGVPDIVEKKPVDEMIPLHDDVRINRV